MFSLLLALWLFRSPKLITGWGDLFVTTKFAGEGKVTVKDASASMLVVFITFALPVSRNIYMLHEGPFTNDVSREGEGGGCPNSDAVRGGCVILVL